MSRKLVALVAALLIGGAAAAQTASIEVSDVWARATPAKAENGAAYLTIESPTADRLVSISTPAALKAELHSMTTDRKSTRLNSSHIQKSRMPSSA